MSDLLPELQIGNLVLPSQLIIAPMAGVTDYPFRVIAREFGAGLTYCEFVAAEGVIREQKRAYDLMRFEEHERPLGIQIFGSRPEAMHECAAKIIQEKQPDILDINFGCPVPKVAKTGGGAAALKDLPLMREIVTAVVEASGGTPVTVKMRAGWSKEMVVVPDVAPMLEACGIAALTLHPRFSNKRYGEPADWQMIKAVKEQVRIPVIGNGDVTDIPSVDAMLEATGCDGIMVARGVMGNPWAIRDMVNHLKSKQSNAQPSIQKHDPTPLDRLRVCTRHLELEIEEMGARRGLNRMRKQFGWYLSKHPQTKKIVHDLVRIPDELTALAVLRDGISKLEADPEAKLVWDEGRLAA